MNRIFAARTQFSDVKFTETTLVFWLPAQQHRMKSTVTQTTATVDYEIHIEIQLAETSRKHNLTSTGHGLGSDVTPRRRPVVVTCHAAVVWLLQDDVVQVERQARHRLALVDDVEIVVVVCGGVTSVQRRQTALSTLVVFLRLLLNNTARQ